MSLFPKIIVVGSHVQGVFVRVQHFPHADETVWGSEYCEAHDGGKGSHQAIACARLGLPTAFVGCVGVDRFGDIAVEWMERAGVDLTHLRRSPRTPTGVGFVMIEPDGTPAIVSILGANAELGVAEVDEANGLFRRARVLLTMLEIPTSTALYAARKGHEAGLITILTPSPIDSQLPPPLPAIDVLIPNEVEAKMLLGLPVDTTMGAENLARDCQKKTGVKRVIVTQGDKGVAVADGPDLFRVPTVAVKAIDTPGAGDAFAAGLACGLACNLSFRAAIRVGCVTGAYAVTVRESIPSFPTLDQLRAFALLHNLEATLFEALTNLETAERPGKPS